MLVIAHRGNCSVAPENTIAAFESASRAGAGAIEFDLQRTVDDHVVVIHSALEDSTSSTGRISEMTLEQVRAVDAGDRMAGYAGLRIPTLEEVLDFLAARPRLGALIEFKRAWNREQVAEVMAKVDAAGISGRSMVQSFRPGVVAALRDVAPDVVRGFLVGGSPPPLERMMDICRGGKVRACNPSLRAVKTGLFDIATFRAAGIDVFVWDANTPADWAMLRERGAAGVITDRPDYLAGWLTGQGLAATPWPGAVTA